MDARVYSMKWPEKLGVLKARALIIDCLIESDASFSAGPHLNTEFFLIMVCNGKIIWEKSGTNRLTKLIWPKNDYMDFLLWGNGISEISLIISGSI